MIALSSNVTKEQTHQLVDDVAFVLTLAVTFHLLAYAIDNKGSLFNIGVLKIFLYLVIATIIFNLLVRPLLKKISIKKREPKNREKIEEPVAIEMEELSISSEDNDSLKV